MNNNIINNNYSSLLSNDIIFTKNNKLKSKTTILKKFKKIQDSIKLSNLSNIHNEKYNEIENMINNIKYIECYSN
jgi:hypothetical protein